MRYYQISEQRLLRILRHPKRVEKGIAPGTLAAMQPTGSRHPTEIWVMYQTINSKSEYQNPKQDTRIITAWRYPGISPVRGKVPIPEDILRELEDIL